MRAKSGCSGVWSIDADGNLTLGWFRWDEEKLSPIETGYRGKKNFTLTAPAGSRKLSDLSRKDGRPTPVSVTGPAAICPVAPGASAFRPAFLFLTRGDVVRPDVWTEFLSDADGPYDTFVHAKCAEAVRTPFLRAGLIESVPTAWGTISLVYAMLRLLRSALLNPASTHFIFASESCVPIKPWMVVASAIRADPRSRIDLKDAEEMKRCHYDRVARLHPRIAREHWKAHSQWLLLDRRAAALLADNDLTAHFAHLYVPDEHYIGTALSILGFPESHVNKSRITYVNWRYGSPALFDAIPDDVVRELKETPAFFARKFSSDSPIADLRLHVR